MPVLHPALHTCNYTCRSSSMVLKPHRLLDDLVSDFTLSINTIHCITKDSQPGIKRHTFGKWLF